jgi:hypothetical protein
MTEKQHFLNYWGYKIGTEEAEAAWKAKQSMTYASSSLVIIPDIQPYKSMITGEIIHSRAKHRNHLRDHNCTEVGNEKVTTKPIEPAKGLREAIERSVYSTK